MAPILLRPGLERDECVEKQPGHDGAAHVGRKGEGVLAHATRGQDKACWKGGTIRSVFTVQDAEPWRHAASGLFRASHAKEVRPLRSSGDSGAGAAEGL